MSQIENKCGECTLCCHVLPIVELKKPPSQLCSHCTIKKGCGIYDQKPNSCKNFDCMYLSSDMSENLRPDKCNVIFEKVTDTIYLGTQHPNHIDAWKEPEVQKYTQNLKDQGISVVISSFTNTPKYLLLAEGETQENINNQLIKTYNNIK